MIIYINKFYRIYVKAHKANYINKMLLLQTLIYIISICIKLRNLSQVKRELLWYCQRKTVPYSILNPNTNSDSFLFKSKEACCNLLNRTRRICYIRDTSILFKFENQFIYIYIYKREKRESAKVWCLRNGSFRRRSTIKDQCFALLFNDQLNINQSLPVPITALAQRNDYKRLIINLLHFVLVRPVRH